MIGLAAKAGKVSSGEFSAERAISSGKAGLCIVAENASENTRKHFHDMCSYRGIRIMDSDVPKSSLGHMIGKKDRAVITIDDPGFSKTIINIIEGGRANGE